MAEAPPRVLITAAAAELLTTLQERNGPLMFHQSGGCCDGSSPMCYPDGDFVVGDRDILLGLLDVGVDKQPDGVPVWIAEPQFAVWKHTQLVIDVVAGRGGGFSLEAPEGMRFLSRGRPFSEAEMVSLQGQKPIQGPLSGVAYERGARLLHTGTHIVAEAPETCPVR